MKVKILLVLMALCMLFMGSAYAYQVGSLDVNDYGIGANVSAFKPTVIKPIFPFSVEQHSTMIQMGDVESLAENSSTSLVECWFVDHNSILLAEFTATEQWQYVDEGDELDSIWVFVNVSKEYCIDWDEAVNNTAVWINFGHVGGDSIIYGYFYRPGYAVNEYSDCFQVGFYGYVPHTFETGLYYLWLTYEVFY